MNLDHVTLLLRYRPLRPQPIFNFNRNARGQQPQRRDDEVAPNIVTDILFTTHTARAVSCRVGRCVHRLSFYVCSPTNKSLFVLILRLGRSHVGSVSSCIDIIRQGRGSLVTTIEIYKIIALNCLVNAFVLSVRQTPVYMWKNVTLCSCPLPWWR